MANNPPQISVTRTPAGVVAPNTQITFTVSATDADARSVQYTFSATDAGGQAAQVTETVVVSDPVTTSAEVDDPAGVATEPAQDPVNPNIWRSVV
jgi:hypothetical protein